MTDEEEVVCTLSHPGEAAITDLRHSIETEGVSEDFWGYACDVQQRIASAFASDNFYIKSGDGTRIGLVAIPGGLNLVRFRKYLGTSSLTLTVSLICVVVGRKVPVIDRQAGAEHAEQWFPLPATAEPSKLNVSGQQRRLRQVFQFHLLNALAGFL